MSYSPEAQAVINRMTDLSAGEEYAIVRMVDALVLSGDWTNLYEVFCFVLSPSDYATGWKLHTLTPQGTTTSQRGVGAEFQAGSDHFLAPFAPSDLEVWNSTGASAGGVIVSASTGSNYDVFGSASGGVEYYFRNRTADDVQAILGSSVATPRLSGIAHPFADFYFAKSVGTARYIRVGDVFAAGTQAAVTPGWATDPYVINGRNSGGQQNGATGISSWHFIGNDSLDDQVMKDAIARFVIDLQNPPGPGLHLIPPTKKRHTARPRRFTLTSFHPWVPNLVLGGLGKASGTSEFFDSTALRNDGILGGNSLWEGDCNTRPAMRYITGEVNFIAKNDLKFDGATADHPFTMACWLYIPGDVTTVQGQMFGIYQNIGQRQLTMGPLGNDLYAFLYDESANAFIGRRVVNWNSFVVTQTWHHFVWTYDGGGISTSNKLYIDGVQRDNNSFEQGIYVQMRPSTDNFEMGGFNSGVGGSLVASQADQLVWKDYVFSPREVRDLARFEDVMLTGMIREAPIPPPNFYPIVTPPPVQSTIFRSRIIRGAM